MVTTKSQLKLVLHALIMLMLLFALIAIFIPGKGTFFYLEVLGFFFLLLLSLTGFIQYQTAWGEPLLFLVYVLYLLNLFLLWYFRGTLYAILVLLAFLGFILGFPSQRKKRVPLPEQVPHSIVLDTPAPAGTSSNTMPSSFPPLSKSSSSKSAQKTTAFTPGKFVASKQSNQFHQPVCDWAKKIRKERRIWFSSKEEAWNKGYRAHSCLK